MSSICGTAQSGQHNVQHRYNINNLFGQFYIKNLPKLVTDFKHTMSKMHVVTEVSSDNCSKNFFLINLSE